MAWADVAAVVLAAGASTRMGQPKALLTWQGRPFVTHAVELARAAGCSPIVVVCGAVPLPDRFLAGATAVHNAAWERGQLSSLQVGLHAVDMPAVSGVLVLTIDRPHVKIPTVQALTNAHRAEQGTIWQPAHEGHRGHPIVFPRDVARQLLTVPPEASPRTLLARPEIQARRKSVDVDDPAVLDNIDRPEDLARLSAGA